MRRFYSLHDTWRRDNSASEVDIVWEILIENPFSIIKFETEKDEKETKMFKRSLLNYAFFHKNITCGILSTKWLAAPSYIMKGLNQCRSMPRTLLASVIVIKTF